MSKIVSMDTALDLIRDGAVVGTSGFMIAGTPESVFRAMGERYAQTGHPRDLTCVFCASQGNAEGQGYDHLAQDGMIAKIIGGHFGLTPKLGKYMAENKCQAYNYPLGVVAGIFRAAIQQRPGELTKVGLKTFVDPRLEGGKINAVTTEDLVKVVEFEGEEWLWYPTPKLDVAIIRGTTGDEDGNITIEHEPVNLEMRTIAMAVKACGGKVIVQVEQVVDYGSIDTRLIKIPGIYVDAIVVAAAENHMQTNGSFYNPAYSGEIRVPVDSLPPLPMGERKIIARRAAMELVPHAVTNLGIGMPEGVAAVAAEEGLEGMVLTTEAGTIGGIPAGGGDFGVTTNPDCVLDEPYQFDFYDGGGLDVAFLGLAQMDAQGNVNVSKFGPKIAGCGGFINITQNAKKVVYCGTFTAGGLKVGVEDGRLLIHQEGKVKKLIPAVEQITFSGQYAVEKGQHAGGLAHHRAGGL